MPKDYVIVAVASDMYLVKIIKCIVQLKLAITIDHNHKKPQIYASPIGGL